MSKRPTIKDIAQVLNISTSTVSRALTDHWDVNPETRKAVLDVAEQLNYNPNPRSLSLRNGQSHIIGVVMPEFVNSYFAEILIGMQRVLFAKGYSILIAQSNESAEIEEKNLKLFERNMVDGIMISMAKDSSNTAYYEHLIKKEVPVVFFNRVPEDMSIPKVIVDDRTWAFKATEHLIQQGCRRIAHFAGSDNLSVSRERKLGYISALKKYGLKVDESLIIETGVLMEAGQNAAMKLLKMEQLPDGLFAVTDPVAIGAMKGLMKNGVRIPQDIAVIGFTESPYATIIEPNLSSVRQPTFDIGSTSARLLLDQLSEIKPASQTIILDASLIIRESSLCKEYRKPVKD